MKRPVWLMLAGVADRGLVDPIRYESQRDPGSTRIGHVPGGSWPVLLSRRGALRLIYPYIDKISRCDRCVS